MVAGFWYHGFVLSAMVLPARMWPDDDRPVRIAPEIAIIRAREDQLILPPLVGIGGIGQLPPEQQLRRRWDQGRQGRQGLGRRWDRGRVGAVAGRRGVWDHVGRFGNFRRVWDRGRALFASDGGWGTKEKKREK